MRLTTKLVPAAALPVIVAVAAFAWGARRGPAVAMKAPLAVTAGHRGLSPRQGARLKGAYRFTKNGWIYVHLQGTPEDVGFQHGYLLAPEIADAFKAIRLEDVHNSHRQWAFFRAAAHKILWPKIYPEYQAELAGIDPEKEAEVTVGAGYLTIRAERHEKVEAPHRSEFRYGTFTRTLSLPDDANVDDVTATYADGILTVTIGTKHEEVESVKKIEITKPKTAKSETVKPETAKSDTAKPATAKSETAK